MEASDLEEETHLAEPAKYAEAWAHIKYRLFLDEPYHIDSLIIIELPAVFWFLEDSECEGWRAW